MCLCGASLLSNGSTQFTSLCHNRYERQPRNEGVELKALIWISKLSPSPLKLLLGKGEVKKELIRSEKSSLALSSQGSDALRWYLQQFE